MVFSKELLEASRRLLARCGRLGWRITTAESCTGGLIAGCLTEIPGASAVFERGFIVYDNDAKSELLGVRPEILEAHGAVSEEVARAMAEGARRHSRAHLALAVTGIAGPSGATGEKPVGLVHIALACKPPQAPDAEILHQRHVFSGDRNAIRLATVGAALVLALKAAEDGKA